MKFETMKKKMQILEQAMAAQAGAYYSINLTKDLVPGEMYQVIEQQSYSINEQIGLPANAKFSDVVAYWGNELPDNEKEAYFAFLSIPHLLQCFQHGEYHVAHSYWTKSVLFKPMLAEQHIVMYADDETDDVLAITYILDLTKAYWKEQYYQKEKEKQLLLALSSDYTSEYICNLDTDVLTPLKQNEDSNAIVLNEDLSDKKFHFSERISYYYHHFIVKESAPDFLEKLNRTYLKKYLQDHERLIYRYEASPNPAGWRKFELQVIRLPGSQEAKALLGFRYIDDVVAEEEMQRKRIEEANQKLETQLHVIGGLTNAYIGVYRVNLTNNRCQSVKNVDFFQNIVGLCQTTDAVVDAFLTYCVRPEDQEKMRAFTDWRKLPERLQHQDSLVEEFHGTVDPFEWCRASWIVASRDAKGTATEVLYTVEDISSIVRVRQKTEQDLKQARDDALAANRAKTTFLFNMSHDIRTPMNAIVGYTALLKKYWDDKEKCLDYLKKIESSSSFLLSLINNVLEMARIESGKAVLDESLVEAEDIGNAVVTVYEETMKKKGIQFLITTHFKTKYFYCDPLKVKEVLLNLLSNAYKYTPSGGKITMDVTELPCEEEGKMTVRVVISDTGIGMTKEYLPTLFEEFSRERTSIRNTVEGTGLGMAIVKNLVELMGGTIAVDSEPGKGTTFTLTLHHRIAKESDWHRNKEQEIDWSLCQGKHILLAEDNDLNAEIAMELLKEYGFIVDRAVDGVECVEKLQKAPAGTFDLILMDIQMPNMNGYEATRLIRGLADEKKRTIPIIAMTANAFEEDRKDALVAGMNEHIAKPLDIPAFAKKLMTVL